MNSSQREIITILFNFEDCLEIWFEQILAKVDERVRRMDQMLIFLPKTM